MEFNNKLKREFDSSLSCSDLIPTKSAKEDFAEV